MNDMVERYIYAVTKRLPSKQRGDIEEELRGLIHDMLEERCGDTPPEERDIRVVLSELGTPSQLAEKYSPDAGKTLIGPPYYSQYKLVLTIVIVCVLAGMSIVAVILAITEPGKAWYEILGRWFASLAGGLIFAFAFVTFFFAFFQRKGIPLNSESDELGSLPPVPAKKEKLSRGESIFGIVLGILFGIFFLPLASHVIGIYIDGSFIPTFQNSVLMSGWYWLIAFVLLGIVHSSFKMYEGRYTKRLMGETIFINILSAVCIILFFGRGDLFNPEFLTAMEALFPEDNSIVMHAISNGNYYFMGVVLFALSLDTGESIYYSLKYDR